MLQDNDRWMIGMHLLLGLWIFFDPPIILLVIQMLSVSVSFENIVKIDFVKVIQRPFKYISSIFIQVTP